MTKDQYLTTAATIGSGAANELGFKQLRITEGESYVGDLPGPDVNTLATILHSSDWHIPSVCWPISYFSCSGISRNGNTC